MADPVTTAPQPAPVTIKNSFSGAVMAFPNGALHTLVASILQLRKQLTVRPERMQQSGWNSELNVFMKKGLIHLKKYVARITYNSKSIEDRELGQGKNADPKNDDIPIGPLGAKGMNQADLKLQATDVTLTLQEQFDNASPASDDILMPPMANRSILQDFTGADLNVPQLDNTNCPNDHFRAFVEALDNFLVQVTRCDSRNDPNHISKGESVQFSGMLDQLWALCIVFGGEANRVDSPAGTLPNDEVNTFMGGPIQNPGATSKVTGA